jgi:hypothetical protein
MLNVHSINDVGKLKYTQPSHGHEPNDFGALTVIENLRRYKSSGIGQALAELIHPGCGMVCSEIVFGIRKKYLSSGRSYCTCKLRVITQIAIINVL